MPNKDNFLALNQSMDDRIALGDVNELSFQEVSGNGAHGGTGVHSSYYKLPFQHNRQ